MSNIRTLCLGKKRFHLDRRPLVMGVLNVTPDSFYDGGRLGSAEEAVEEGLLMEADGADVIDVGGESTRPGAPGVGKDEELARILPVIEGIRKRSGIPITVDTNKAGVAREALLAGADGINDISGLTFDPQMLPLAAGSDCTVVIGHIQGTPLTMQQGPLYKDVVEEVSGFLARQAGALMEAGLERDRIVIDPGIGFGKTVQNNLELLANLTVLRELGFAVLVGASMKSFIGKILDLPPPERLEGSLAAAALSVWNGADILRVHHVKSTVRAVRTADAIRKHYRKVDTRP